MYTSKSATAPVIYPELLNESTNFRIKKIMDDENHLREEVKFRDSMCKKYGRFSTMIDVLEYTLILGDIVIGTTAAALPGVGSVISTAIFSGVGLISGAAKLIQVRLNNKKLKHSHFSTVAATTLTNLHHKISKAISDGNISHEEFEDIQSTMNEWKNEKTPNKHTQSLTPEIIQALTQQAQKELIEKIKNQ